MHLPNPGPTAPTVRFIVQYRHVRFSHVVTLLSMYGWCGIDLLALLKLRGCHLLLEKVVSGNGWMRSVKGIIWCTYLLFDIWPNVVFCCLVSRIRLKSHSKFLKWLCDHNYINPGLHNVILVHLHQYCAQIRLVWFCARILSYFVTRPAENHVFFDVHPVLWPSYNGHPGSLRIVAIQDSTCIAIQV